MDKYTKILLIIVILIYANAIFFYFKDNYTTTGGINFGNIQSNLQNKNSSSISSGPLISFESDDQNVQKTTKEGDIIEKEYGSGEIEIQNFTFDQKNSKIQAVLVSFKTLKIRPKPLCWQEEVTENITVSVPPVTGMSVNGIIDSLPKNTGAPVQVPDIPGNAGNEDFSQVISENNITNNDLTQEVSYYVTKCQTAEDVYLSSIFGTVDIMQNNEVLSSYSLTFTKEENDDQMNTYLTVEKDIYLPPEPGKYSLRVIIWDKLSSLQVEHDEDFYVK